MALIVGDRPGAGSPGLCAADGMPLYPTIVGPRCPLCGAGPSSPPTAVPDRAAA